MTHADGHQVAHAGAAHVEHGEEHTVVHAAQAGSHAQGQQHPLRVYLKIWGWLFVLSVASYMVDYYDLQGLLRWFLIITFMLLKAGLIVAVFMHMLWERLALVYAVIVPPLLLVTLLGIGALEAQYTFFTRGVFFASPADVPPPPPPPGAPH